MPDLEGRKERKKRLQHEYYISHLAYFKQKEKIRRETHKEELTIYHKNYQNRLRMELIMILGGPVCMSQSCPISPEKLVPNGVQIDHKNGGGRQDRKTLAGPIRFYHYYLGHPEEAKEKLQVLCGYCNQLKRVTT